MEKSTIPSDLKDAGKALWESIAGHYELRADEVARLALACRKADMLAEMEAEFEKIGRPMTATGSMGQEIIHPVYAEIGKQQVALDQMLVRLKLPDAGDDAPSVNQNRDAANSSWKPGVRSRGA